MNRSRYKIRYNQNGGNSENIEYLERLYGINKDDLPKNENNHDIFDIIISNTSNVKDEFSELKSKLEHWAPKSIPKKWNKKKEMILRYPPFEINMDKIKYINNSTYLPNIDEIKQYKYIGIDTEGNTYDVSYNIILIQICFYKNPMEYDIYLIPFKNDHTIYFKSGTPTQVHDDIRQFIKNIYEQIEIPILFCDAGNDINLFGITPIKYCDISLEHYRNRKSLSTLSSEILNKNIYIYETNKTCPTYTKWGSYDYKGAGLKLLTSQKMYSAMDALLPCMILEEMVKHDENILSKKCETYKDFTHRKSIPKPKKRYTYDDYEY
jgi:hypothetical protein